MLLSPTEIRLINYFPPLILNENVIMSGQKCQNSLMWYIFYIWFISTLMKWRGLDITDTAVLCKHDRYSMVWKTITELIHPLSIIVLSLFLSLFCLFRFLCHFWGDSSVVWVPNSWLKGCKFKSLQEQQENFLLQGRLSVLTLILVSSPPPCYRSST